MATKIEEIEGIGPAQGEKLRNVGIKSVEDLLAKCGQNAGREAVAAETGISEKLLLDWANMADLMRIDGIGPEFAELLEAAGVDTVKELRNRKPANLHAKMVEVNEAKKLVRALPTEKAVESWVEQAKGLPPTMTY